MLKNISKLFPFKFTTLLVIISVLIHCEGKQQQIKTIKEDSFVQIAHIDINGIIYNTIKLGDQVWLAENLRETKYRTGEDIPNITDNATWTALTTGACCAYNNDWETYICVPEPTTTTTTTAVPTTTTTTTTP